LHAIDELFCSHDRETNTSKYPWEGRVHLVCSCIFQCSSTVRIGKEKARRGRRTPGLKCRCGSIVRNLEKGRRQKWRREGKEVQGDEEEFVESAEDEQNRLEGISSPCKLQQQGYVPCSYNTNSRGSFCFCRHSYDSLPLLP
jgi:hypothetical protein